MPKDFYAAGAQCANASELKVSVDINIIYNNFRR